MSIIRKIEPWERSLCKEYWFYGLNNKKICNLCWISKQVEEYESPNSKKSYIKALIPTSVKDFGILRPLKSKPTDALFWKGEYSSHA